MQRLRGGQLAAGRDDVVQPDVLRLLLHDHDGHDRVPAGRDHGGHVVGDDRLAGLDLVALGHVGGEALALQLDRVQAEVDEHAHVVGAHDDVGVRQHLQHGPADRGHRVDDLVRRVDGGAGADEAFGEGRVRDLLHRHGSAADRGENLGDPGASGRGGLVRSGRRRGGHRRRGVRHRRGHHDRGGTGHGVRDLALQDLGLGAEDGLHVVADLDHAGGAERLQASLVDLVLVGDLHPQPGDARVDVDQVLPAPEGGDQPLGLGVGERSRRDAAAPADEPGTVLVLEVGGLLGLELVLAARDRGSAGPTTGWPGGRARSRRRRRPGP